MHMYEHLFLNTTTRKFSTFRLFLCEQNLIQARTKMYCIVLQHVNRVYSLCRHKTSRSSHEYFCNGTCRTVSIGCSIMRDFRFFERDLLENFMACADKVQTSCYIGIINIAHEYIGCFMIFTCYLSLAIWWLSVEKNETSCD